jgi:Ca2+-binding RTX toxin-like protein
MTILQGGSGNDTFKFTDPSPFLLPIVGPASINGSINGGGGTNTLDYSALAGPVTVNLATHAASRIRAGNAGGFSNIQTVIGTGSTADTLTGPDAYTDWIISAANHGKVASVVFTGFENLVGGSGVDSFRFLASGSVSGTVDGGAAPAHQGNWLDYSNLSVPVTVNLQTGAATRVGGGVSNIQNVHGSSGGNTLTGNSQGNILIGGAGADTIHGGTGRSILIGDGGADIVVGGSGSDILIGDATTFDAMTTNNQKALMAVLAEWQSADSSATRFTDINTGNGLGLNGHAKLNFGTTVLDDGAADSVTGVVLAQALDWFFRGAGDTLHNVQAGEHLNNT